MSDVFFYISPFFLVSFVEVSSFMGDISSWFKVLSNLPSIVLKEFASATAKPTWEKIISNSGPIL